MIAAASLPMDQGIQVEDLLQLCLGSRSCREVPTLTCRMPYVRHVELHAGVGTAFIVLQWRHQADEVIFVRLLCGSSCWKGGNLTGDLCEVVEGTVRHVCPIRDHFNLVTTTNVTQHQVEAKSEHVNPLPNS